jgi:ribosomal protein S18 acetylase RimI-like enzyme
MMSTAEKQFSIRRMTQDDVLLAVEWAAEEGWNPGLNDAVNFYETDPHGFFIGELNDAPIGCISAVRYGSSFGFIGFYIIRKELRGKWYGVMLGRTAMGYLNDRNIGIDGVEAKIKNYEKFGFNLAHRNIRHEGKGGGSRCARVVDLAGLSFDTIASYDQEIFPARRNLFLKQWITQPGSSLGYVENGRLKGYGVLRPCRTGFKIGPLFADKAAIAEQLFQALAADVPADTSLFLDVPATNPAALALARNHGMTPVFETGRMYTREIPDLPIDMIFGITSFELG